MATADRLARASQARMAAYWLSDPFRHDCLAPYDGSSPGQAMSLYAPARCLGIRQDVLNRAAHRLEDLNRHSTGQGLYAVDRYREGDVGLDAERAAGLCCRNEFRKCAIVSR
jgi:hypothetical protein